MDTIGSGSAASGHPPDNASGNFVHVPQRIAVRIRIDANRPLAAGLWPGHVDRGTDRHPEPKH